MLRCHQEGGGVNPQKRVLWQVSQVSRAAFPEQAELAIKRLGGKFCEHPWKGGMDLEETELVTAHFIIMFSLIEKCDSGEDKQVWLDWRIDVYNTNTCALITVGFFPLFAFFHGMCVILSVLQNLVEMHWCHLLCWQVWGVSGTYGEGKPGHAGLITSNPTWERRHWRPQENNKNFNSSGLSLSRGVIKKTIFICK